MWNVNDSNEQKMKIIDKLDNYCFLYIYVGRGGGRGILVTDEKIIFS